MDSLFDASLFDAPKPAVVVDPPEPEPAPSLFDLLAEPGSSDVAPAPDDAPTVAGNALLPEPVADEAGAPAVELELPADGDVTEVLNDPDWEPPVDDIGEIAELIADDVLETGDVDGISIDEPVIDEPPAVEAVVEEPPAVEPHSVEVGEELSPDEIEDGRSGFWSEIVGQTSAVSLLQASVPNPVHAYLFVGAPGSGKQAAALRFGAALVCPYGGCGRCNSCARALIQAHPDVLVVEREGASISVDQAREIIRLAARSPLEGDRKVLILVDFHLVTQAAPTLLKIIEEPPPSTVFIVLAEQITSELVTIASRCVTVGFAPLSVEAITRALVAEGAELDVAEKSAAASGGRLDRARLLATDPALGQRVSFWQMVPQRLNGTGAAVSVLADEAVGLLDAAAVAPLEARQAAELAHLEARLEATGGRGGIGQRKELMERHKRELKRLRDDEVRLGLGVIQQIYRQTLVQPDTSALDVKAALGAIQRISSANEQLVRNPNLALWFRALFLDLPAR